MAQTKSDRVSIDLITPKGVAIYPKLNTPSTTFHQEGEYEVKLRIDPDADGALLGKADATFAEMVTAIEAQQATYLADKQAELAASKDPKNRKKAKEITSKEFGADDIGDDEEPTGNRIIKLKMKASGVSKDGKPWSRKPKLFDAKGRALPDDAPAIWGGSVLKVAAKAVPYYMPKENEVGTTLYLEAVQVIELVSGSGRTAEAYGFGAEEGYETEEETAAATVSAADGTPNF